MTRPVAQTHNLNELECVPSSDVSPDLWTVVHEQVQEQLALLESEVRRRVAEVRVDKGRTRGERYYLFTYRTFSIPGSGLDPIVTGVTFTPAKGSVSVDADVSGEQTGDCIATVPSKTVANSREDLLAAAGESAGKLCQWGEAIALALKDPSRRGE
ncbi:MAG: hypothetical protein HY040_27615 [Planctomycetes bacterium]|nr:hypothetical protein [Planctomycetota bacterium]